MMMSSSIAASSAPVLGRRMAVRKTSGVRPVAAARRSATVAMAEVSQEGFEMRRKGVKEAAKATVLTPRFYTTDFDEMEKLFTKGSYGKLNENEFQSLLDEFKADYNQTHFVRDDSFRAAADKITGADRKIFVEFLERSCTAEFSGFLLYKELGRRLKKTNPVIAEIFTLMSRDEARHAGFLNKSLSDFDLALDLGWMTKSREYTFFEPKFILYATYLSEKIGYWRYITIYRHLQKDPDNTLYPIFNKFENWCQDENRHGDFCSALLKAQPDMLKGFQGVLWSKFFCLSVYVTMYLNDSQRKDFYASVGLDAKEFDMHVIHNTNDTTATIFPVVIDTHNPEFKRRLDAMVEANEKIIAAGDNKLAALPSIISIGINFLGLMLMKGRETEASWKEDLQIVY